MKAFLIAASLFCLIASPAFPAKASSGSSLLDFIKGYRDAQAGRYDSAIEYYRSALSLDPGSASIRTELALLYVKKGEFNRAEALLKESVQAEPDRKSVV
jgi:tetratricopeptide (TPR) repeat protein